MDEARLTAAHWDYATALHAVGRLRFAGRSLSPDDVFALLVVSTEDEHAAQRIGRMRRQGACTNEPAGAPTWVPAARD